MNLEMVIEPIENLDKHGNIPIAFTVDRILAVSIEDAGLRGFSLTETIVDVPWIKDYDADKGPPTRWLERFDTSRWGLLTVMSDGVRVGGAVVAMGSRSVGARGKIGCCGTLGHSSASRSAIGWTRHGSVQSG